MAIISLRTVPQIIWIFVSSVSSKEWSHLKILSGMERAGLLRSMIQVQSPSSEATSLGIA